MTFERDGDRLIQAGPTYKMRFANVHQITVEGGPIDQVEQGVSVRGWYGTGEYEATPVAWLNVEPEVTVGRFIDYALLVPGDAIELSLKTGLIPLPALRLDTTATWGRFEPDVAGAAGQPQLGRSVRNRLNWQFSRALGLRVIEQWSGASDQTPLLASSALLSWLKVPGTAAYLGYSELTDLASGGMVERSVFAKVTVLLRP
jgi:hypothetical protein